MIYQEPSLNFNPRVEVSALFIEHGNHILMLHRHEFKLQGNLWGIPAGKVDCGETPLDAAIREACEETGYHFQKETVESVGTVYIEYGEQEHFIYHMFRTKLEGDPGHVKINFKEHKGFTWVTPEDALRMELIKDEDACLKLAYNLESVVDFK